MWHVSLHFLLKYEHIHCRHSIWWIYLKLPHFSAQLTFQVHWGYAFAQYCNWWPNYNVFLSKFSVCNQWNILTYCYFKPWAHLHSTAIHYAKWLCGGFVPFFLALPQLPWKYMKRGEKEGEREREREITLSNCQYKAGNILNASHTRLYANNKPCVCGSKCVCICVFVNM